jgi:type II secretory pathway component PulK
MERAVIAPMGASRETGSVLIVCLWILTTLALLALGLSYRLRIGLRLAAHQWDEIRLVQIAKLGTAAAMVAVQKSTASYAALNQPWSHDPDRFRNRLVRGGTFTLEHRRENPAAGETLLFGLEDEAGRINLNTAPRLVLESLFAAAPEVVPALLDWRDADSNPQEGGAEDAEYQNLPRPYACRNGALRSVEELLLVRGVTPLLFQEVKNLVTVYSAGPVNINTAAPETLRAMGLTDNLVNAIAEFRRGSEDPAEGTADDGVFKTLAQAMADLSHGYDLSPDDIKSWNDRLPWLAVQSDTFRANVIARLDDRPFVRRFAIGLSPKRAAGRVRYWREEV